MAAPLPIRTLQLSRQPGWEPSMSAPVVSLGRLGGNQEQLVLVHNAAAPDEEACLDTWAEVSVLAAEDAFPGYAMDGREMIWMKDYSENKGIKEDLLTAGWIIPVGRTMKQGFVTLPLMLVNLQESEFVQQCALCNKWEFPPGIGSSASAAAAPTSAAEGAVAVVAEAEKRFGKCSKCRQRYYCCKEHQIEDWKAHRPYCKLLIERNRYEVVNLHRRTIQSWMAEQS